MLVSMASEFYTKARGLFKGFVMRRSLSAISGLTPRTNLVGNILPLVFLQV